MCSSEFHVATPRKKADSKKFSTARTIYTSFFFFIIIIVIVVVIIIIIIIISYSLHFSSGRGQLDRPLMFASGSLQRSYATKGKQTNGRTGRNLERQKGILADRQAHILNRTNKARICPLDGDLEG